MSIIIKNLTVTFKNKVTAIDHGNLEIPRGVFGLLGENGAGKTTLMRVLTTLITPDEGEITLDGIPYREENYPRIQSKIGYLPQEIDLYPGLTLQECMEYMGTLSGLTKRYPENGQTTIWRKPGLPDRGKRKCVSCPAE